MVPRDGRTPGRLDGNALGLPEHSQGGGRAGELGRCRRDGTHSETFGFKSG